MTNKIRVLICLAVLAFSVAFLGQCDIEREQPVSPVPRPTLSAPVSPQVCPEGGV